MQEPASLRSHAPAALAVLAVVLPLGIACLLADPFEFGDTSLFFAPLHRVVVEALRAGRLPLWDPTAAMGLPLFAEGMHGVLHPVSLLSALDPAARIEPVILAWFAVAALGAFALARAFGSTATAAFVASVAYGLSGYVVSMGTNLVYLAGAASLPWMLAAGRALGTGARGMAWVALATALAALAGEFQALFLGLLLAVLLAAHAGGLAAALRAAAGEALGLALAGVQLVPSWVHLGRTTRAVADVGATHVWSFSPWRLVELFSPGFFMRYDASADSVFRALTRAPGADYLDFPWATSVFIGAPVLILAAAGVRDRTGRVLFALAGLALWMSFGHRLGASQLLGHVPLWGRFRYSEKMIGPFTLLVAILAARGLDGLRAGRTRRLELAAWAAAAAGTVLGTAAILGAFDGLAPAADRRLASGATWIVAGSAAAAALLRASRRAPAERLALAGLAAVIYAGSASAAQLALHLGLPLDLGTIARRIPADPLLTRVAVPYGGAGPSVEGGDQFDAWLRSESRLPVPSYNLLHGLDTVDVYSALEPGRYWAVKRPFWDERWKLFRRFGASHAVICWPTDERQARVAAVATAGARLLFRDARERVDVWDLPHRPWAAFAPGVRPVPGPREAVSELERLWRQGTEDVVVEAPAGEPPFATAAGRVLGLERRSQRVRVDAEADGPAFLVVNDAWWEGWEATIDGAPVPIRPVDGLVRGMRFPAGRHRLDMEYRPPELRAGAVVSAAALVALAALVAARALRRPRPPA